MKKVKINGKWYEVKQVDETSEETSEEVDEVEEEESATTEGGTTEETTEETDSEEEDVDSKIDEAAEKIMSKLNLDKIHEKLDALSGNESDVKGEKEEKKASAVIDLEALMNKDVKEMTAREKILGFFQGAVQNDRAVLKALSEGKCIIALYKFGELLGNPFKRTISSQALV